MHRIPAWVLAAVPLAIAPGLSFYFDVIPRLSLLLTVVGACLFFRRDIASELAAFCSDRITKVFCVAALGFAVSLFVSTVFSVNASLSIYGSTWRRFGIITQIALLILTVLLAVDFAARRDRMRHMLRAFAA